MEDLGLDIFRFKGRAPVPVTAAYVRDLTEADLAMLQENGPKGSKTPALKRLSERHRSLARLIAMGTPYGEAALITGYVQSSVSILMTDPTFQDLVEFYRKDSERRCLDLHEKMSANALDASDILHERMVDDPDRIPTSQIIEIIKMGADRTGFGPKTTQTVNVNVNLAERLEAARKRVAERRMIDVTPEAAE